jgi:hypothetical protein
MKLSITGMTPRIEHTLMGFPLFLETALELDNVLLEAGSLLQQLIDPPCGLFQFR